MDFNELKKALAAEAAAAGICREWYDYILQADSQERLLTLFYKGLDFVIGNDFPSKPLRDAFDGRRQAFNIWDEGETFNSYNPRRLLAYAGASGKVRVDDYAVCELWARGGSEIEITASGWGFATIDVAPGAEVTVKASDHARVSIFNHGGKVQEQRAEEATIRTINK